jgi:hypothetical protein
MPTILKTKNSVTTTVVPTTLQQGELAVNITDKKMWVGNAATTPVQIVGAGATNRAGGSNTQVQYNSSGDLAGSANLTFDGTNLSTTGTVGIGAFAAAPETALNVRFIGNLTSTDITGASVSISAPATASNSTNGYYSSLRTTATAGARGSLSCFYAEQPSIGAGSSVTSANGVFVRNQGNAAITNAYGVRIEPQSGATGVNYGIYNEGTSRFNGNIGLDTAPAASGTGITFPATQSASSDANTLDDYEEGTWTPSDASGAGLSFTVTSAQYVKVGQMVTATAVFQYPVTANATACNVGGLPFSTNMNNTTGSVLSSNAGAQKVIQSGTTTFLLFPVNSVSQSTNVTLSNATIYVTLHYRCNT